MNYKEKPQYKQYLKKRDYLRAYKEAHPCADCHQSYPYYVMDFDHVRGVKTEGLARINLLGMRRIMDEIDKCDLVCANCHRRRTAHRIMYMDGVLTNL